MTHEMKTNPMVKTISIEARPMWETKKHLTPYLSEDSLDRQRILKYREAKEILNHYARNVIAIATQKIADEHMAPTYEMLEQLFVSANDIKTRKEYKKAATDFKKHMADVIKKSAEEYQLTKEFGKLFHKEKSALYQNAEMFRFSKEDLDTLALYNGFTSYFKKYFTTLSGVILCGTEYGSIAARILENMESCFKNHQILEQIREEHPQLYTLLLDKVNQMDICMCMTQEGIDSYNRLLGNMENNGINSIINQYAQKYHVRIKRCKTFCKIPLAKVEKQVVIEFISNDEELKETVSNSLPVVETILAFAKRTAALRLDDETKESTYLLSRNLNILSHRMYGRHDLLEKSLKQTELSQKEKEEGVIRITSLEKAMQDIEEDPKQTWEEIIRSDMEKALEAGYRLDSIRQLCEQNSLKANRKKIKGFYDLILAVRKSVSFFYTGEIENTFIEELAAIKEDLAAFNKIYNMVRNYCTKNPIQKESFDMFFQKGTFLSSFDSDKFKEGTSLSTLLRKDGMYYLYVLNPKVSTKLKEEAYVAEGGYDRLVYKQLTGLNKVFPKCFISAKSAAEVYGATEEMRDIVANKKYTKEAADRESCVKWIQFCIDAFRKNEDWMKYYHVPFQKAEAYESANDFYTKTEKYTIYMEWAEHLDEAYVRQSVMDGSAFLFQLYNHDFSPYHTGKDGNYTRILKELFSEENLYKINETDQTALKLASGGATLSFREASLPYKETHKANEPLKNKNPMNPKTESVFPYAICKNRRFMSDKFILRIGVQFGFRNEEKNAYALNQKVNEQVLKENPNLLTVRAGEEHLLYYMVTDADGNILEQNHLNVIDTKSSHCVMRKDFKEILKVREKEMADAKEEWNYSVDVADVKKGYVAYAVRSILDIRDKYDAVILLEDYSADFVQKRRANVKAVYQQFQAALLNKLACYVPQGKTYGEALQLSMPVSSLDDLKGQRGIVYFVNSAYTSNTDPTCGFCNHYQDAFMYENKKKADTICSRLSVTFHEDRQEFLITLKDEDFGFNTGKLWTLHTRGERSLWKDGKILSFDCNEELKELMREYHISEFKEYKNVADKAFYERFFHIMRVLLRMHYASLDMDSDSYFLSPVTGYDSSVKQEKELNSSSSVKTYLVMLKGKRMLERIDRESYLVLWEEKGKHKENWLSYLQSVN